MLNKKQRYVIMVMYGLLCIFREENAQDLGLLQAEGMRMSRKAKARKIIYVGIVVGSLLLGLGSLFLPFHKQEAKASEVNEEGKRVVTVAYYESPSFEEGMSDDAVKSGYAYEYLQKLSDYTGWEYEYVYGDWTDLYEMLVEGEVDLMAGLAYMEAREAVFSYPDYEMGTENYYIYRSKDGEIIDTYNTASFNGKRVGVTEGTQTERFLQSWASQNDVELTVVELSGVAEAIEAMENGQVDYIATTDNNISANGDYIALAQIGSAPYYIVVAQDEPELLAELNEAVAIINDTYPYYTEELRAKYFNQSAVNASLSASEKEWLEEHDTLRIGYLSDYMPFSDSDNGKATGLLTDVMPEILGVLGIDDQLALSYYCYDSYDDLEAALKAGDIDLLFPLYINSWYGEQHDLVLSSSVAETTLQLIYEGEYSQDKVQRIAISARSPLHRMYALQYYPDSELVVVDNAKACMEAVMNGTADSTILSIYKAEYYLNSASYRSLNSTELQHNVDYGFAADCGDEALVILINRGIALLPDEFVDESLYSYATYEYNYTAVDFIADNLLLCGVLLLLVLVLCILFLVAAFDRKRAKKEAAFFERNHEIELFINDAMNRALGQVEPEKSIRQLIKYLGQAFGADRVYIFEDNEDGLTTTDTYEWCAEGVATQRENMQDFDKSMMSRWYDAFSGNRSILIRDTEAERASYPKTYELMKMQNVTSLIVAPLYMGERLIGFYGVDNPDLTKADEIGMFLETIGSFLVSLLMMRDSFRKEQDAANLDLLTGIANRGCGERQIRELLAEGKQGMFCLLDADKFKNINDTYGHAVGDKVIIAIADKLKECFREDDVVMRLGGDEFAVYALGEMTEDVAMRRVERIHTAMKTITIEEMQDETIEVSIGMLLVDQPREVTFDEIYRKTDMRLYAQKQKKKSASYIII